MTMVSERCKGRLHKVEGGGQCDHCHYVRPGGREGWQCDQVVLIDVQALREHAAMMRRYWR